MNVAISPELKAYVDRQIAEASYASPSEYVRELIRQDRRRKAEQCLSELVREGLESPEELEDPKYWERRRQVLRRSMAKKR